MTIETAQAQLDQLRQQAHPGCIACGGVDGQVPRLRFTAVGPRRVEAWFLPKPAYEGYPGILHGGIVATLLDAAMTNCLFAQGRSAVTGELTVRFREPVRSDRACCVSAWLERDVAPLFYLRAELSQEHRVRSRASAKFMLRRASVPPPAS